MTRPPRPALFVSLLLAAGLTLSACGSENDLAAADAAPAPHAMADHSSSSANAKTPHVSRATFHDDMRQLWIDHVTWTRLYLVSAIARLPDVDATAARLLQNQDDIGAAIAPFYGDGAAVELTSLLHDHITIAVDLVAAAKAGDGAAVQTHLARWYANADAIAAFLAGANPAWPEDTLQQMMHTHLDQTLAEAAARLQGDWNADVTEYDHIVAHILEMADTLSDGIIKQFPHHFSA
jgi:hypothetical protein